MIHKANASTTLLSLILTTAPSLALADVGDREVREFRSRIGVALGRLDCAVRTEPADGSDLVRHTTLTTLNLEQTVPTHPSPVAEISETKDFGSDLSAAEQECAWVQEVAASSRNGFGFLPADVTITREIKPASDTACALSEITQVELISIDGIVDPEKGELALKIDGEEVLLNSNCTLPGWQN